MPTKKESKPKPEEAPKHTPEQLSAIATHKLQEGMKALTRSEEASLYGYMAYRFDWHEAPEKTQTAATDGISCYYDPAYVASLTPNQVAGLIQHEMSHIVHMSPTRGTRLQRLAPEDRPYNHDQANIAADRAINQYIPERFKFTGMMEKEDRHQGLAFEDIYDLDYQTKPKNKNDGNDEGNGEGEGDGPPNHGPGGFDIPEEQEQKQAEQKAQEAVSGAMKDARSAKADPKSIETALKGTPFEIARQLDWRTIIHRHLNRLASGQYSYARPSRRSPEPFILPQFKARTSARILAALDVSGSVDPVAVGEFTQTLLDLVANFQNLEIRLITHNSGIVFDSGEFVPAQALTIGELALGGGTRFEPVYELANSLDLDLILHWTDLEPCGWPEAPNAPIVFLSWCSRKGEQAPYGETVEIEP